MARPHPIGRRFVSARLQQQRHTLLLTVFGRHVQRRAADLVRRGTRIYIPLHPVASGGEGRGGGGRGRTSLLASVLACHSSSSLTHSSLPLWAARCKGVQPAWCDAAPSTPISPTAPLAQSDTRRREWPHIVRGVLIGASLQQQPRARVLALVSGYMQRRVAPLCGRAHGANVGNSGLLVPVRPAQDTPQGEEWPHVICGLFVRARL